jgi:hypothetical protein
VLDGLASGKLKPMMIVYVHRFMESNEQIGRSSSPWTNPDPIRYHIGIGRGSSPELRGASVFMTVYSFAIASAARQSSVVFGQAVPR